MLAAADFTWLLVNLENMTTMPRVDRGSKNGIVWKVEKAVPVLYMQIRSPQPMESCFIWDMTQPFYKLHSRFWSAF